MIPSNNENVPLNRKLFDAVYYADVDKVFELIFEGANPSWKNEAGNQCIHAASHHGSERIVQILLNAGVSPNCLGKNKNTPLHFAAFIGHENVVRLLLTNGADPRIKNDKGKTVREMCVSEDHNMILKLLNEWVINRCTFLNVNEDEQADIHNNDVGKQMSRQSSYASITSHHSEDADIVIGNLVNKASQLTTNVMKVGEPLKEIQKKEHTLQVGSTINPESIHSPKGQDKLTGGTQHDDNQPFRRAIPNKTNHDNIQPHGIVEKDPYSVIETQSCNTSENKIYSKLDNDDGLSQTETSIYSPQRNTSKDVQEGYTITIDGKEVFVPETAKVSWEEDDFEDFSRFGELQQQNESTRTLDNTNPVNVESKQSNETELMQDEHFQASEKSKEDNFVTSSFNDMVSTARLAPLANFGLAASKHLNLFSKGFEYTYSESERQVTLIRGPFGLGMQLEDWNGKVRVCAIREGEGNEDSINFPAASQGVHVGDFVNVINDIPTNGSLNVAMSLLQESKGNKVDMTLVRIIPRIFLHDEINWSTENPDLLQEIIHFACTANVKQEKLERLLGVLNSLEKGINAAFLDDNLLVSLRAGLEYSKREGYIDDQNSELRDNAQQLVSLLQQKIHTLSMQEKQSESIQKSTFSNVMFNVFGR